MRAKETYVIARFDEVDLDCQLSTAFDAGATAGVDAFSCSSPGITTLQTQKRRPAGKTGLSGCWCLWVVDLMGYFTGLSVINEGPYKKFWQKRSLFHVKGGGGDKFMAINRSTMIDVIS